MLQLTEWHRSSPLELSHVERRVLEDRFAARIESTADPALLRVVPGSVVGTLQVGQRTITVAPKIPIDRVLFMTAYAVDPFGWEDEWSTLGRTDDLIAGLARLFVRMGDAVLSKGLLRSYREERGDLPFIRGKVNWGQQVRRAVPVPVALTYRVHDDDVVENQIVRAALSVLRNLAPVSEEEEAASLALGRMWRQFRDFAVLRQPLAALARMVWTRHNEHYRPLLELCRIILENQMAEVDAGSVPVHGFTLNMPDVFERFVRCGLEQASAVSLATPKGRALTLDHDDRFPLKPDLAARREDQWLFIGDVKYKRDDGHGKNADLYQLLAYATAAQLPEATLIYADGPEVTGHHRIRFVDKTLRIARLDLRLAPRDVLRQLSGIWSDTANTR